MTEYVKVIGSTEEYPNVAFYINKDYVEHTTSNHRNLLRFAEIAVDLDRNEVIKCRYLLDQIFDKILLTNRLHCDTILNNL